jgi:hypothetical protein
LVQNFIQITSFGIVALKIIRFQRATIPNDSPFTRSVSSSVPWGHYQECKTLGTNTTAVVSPVVSPGTLPRMQKIQQCQTMCVLWIERRITTNLQLRVLGIEPAWSRTYKTKKKCECWESNLRGHEHTKQKKSASAGNRTCVVTNIQNKKKVRVLGIEPAWSRTYKTKCDCWESNLRGQEHTKQSASAGNRTCVVKNIQNKVRLLGIEPARHREHRSQFRFAGFQ